MAVCHRWHSCALEAVRFWRSAISMGKKFHRISGIFFSISRFFFSLLFVMSASSSSADCDIGLIGLAVMGENLVLNMESKGFKVAVWNRTQSKVDAFVGGRGANKNIVGAQSAEELVASLKSPRIIMIMVRAGWPVDATIEKVAPLLERGDIIVDGGNSNFEDTSKRCKQLEEQGLLFVGSGVSGGEEGALNGPSIMPGGAAKAWPAVRPIFQAIAARVDDGSPCCDWLGNGGAGHYVKMVHNGVEYGDMQLICEAYHVLRTLASMGNAELSETFAKWNRGALDSYLIEITAEIFAKDDEMAPGTQVVDNILDRAGQKGTGKWTTISALDVGMPVTLIGEAVFARCLSAQKDERVAAADRLAPLEPLPAFAGDRDALVADVENAIYASKLVSYAQGFVLLRAASDHYEWQLNYGNVALMWRGGCIIRSKFLGNIKEAFERDEALPNLLLDDFFREKILAAEAGWRRVAALAIQHGIPIPAISSALAYFDGYRTARLPANLLQAQRDFFGAHTYQRIDKPANESFHTNWTGRGGDTAASTYTI
jgi:6-phosphogluconate dehydrogenase